MKHYNVSTKKFIKNIVCLTVSALLLAAATFAWFATGSQVSVDQSYASIVGQIQFDFMHLNLADTTTFLDGNASSLTIRDRSETPEPASTDVDTFLINSSNWVSSSDNAWDISSMYPGEYGAYKISYDSDGATRNLVFSTVTCNSNDAANSICVYAVAKKTTSNGATPQTIVSRNCTLKTLIDEQSGGSVNVLEGIASSQGDSVDIYYVIGMPAADFAGVHDTLRQAENTVTASIQSIDTITTSGSGSSGS